MSMSYFLVLFASGMGDRHSRPGREKLHLCYWLAEECIGYYTRAA
jgi:hypothetical protein